MSEEKTDWAAYDAFLKDAEKDDRVGHQDFLVTSVEESAWPSGDKFTRVRGQLTTAGGAKADFNLNPLPSQEELAQSGTWEKGKKRGVAQGIAFVKALATIYGKSASTLSAGDELRVNCVRNKEGYIRIVALLDPKVDRALASKADTKKDSSVPF